MEFLDLGFSRFPDGTRFLDLRLEIFRSEIPNFKIPKFEIRSWRFLELRHLFFRYFESDLRFLDSSFEIPHFDEPEF
jgi:hypothetical protein